jgi:hypothetical protein
MAHGSIPIAKPKNTDSPKPSLKGWPVEDTSSFLALAWVEARKSFYSYRQLRNRAKYPSSPFTSMV